MPHRTAPHRTAPTCPPKGTPLTETKFPRSLERTWVWRAFEGASLASRGLQYEYGQSRTELRTLTHVKV
jgi:hypothetical protein